MVNLKQAILVITAALAISSAAYAENSLSKHTTNNTSFNMSLARFR